MAQLKVKIALIYKWQLLEEFFNNDYPIERKQSY